MFLPRNHLISDLAYHYGTRGSFELVYAYDLRDALTKVPLSLQDTQAASAVIRILGHELIYSTAATKLIRGHGLQLCNVLSSIILVRELTNDEIQVINSLAMRRLERSVSCLVFVFFYNGSQSQL